MAAGMIGAAIPQSHGGRPGILAVVPPNIYVVPQII